MGQKIVVNGQVRQLPKVFMDERELRNFLGEVAERALQTLKYAGKFKEDSVTLTFDCKELHREGGERLVDAPSQSLEGAPCHGGLEL
jgi:hypothetical protein